jgi:hypothetical protein
MTFVSTILLLMPEPDKIRFGGGLSESSLSPIVAVAVLIAGAFLCFGSRKKAIVAFLTAAVLIPTDQVLLIGGLHFPAMRILALFGLGRILWAKFHSKAEIFSGGMNGIDKALIVLTVAAAVNGVLLWQESAVVVFQLGNLYSAFGLYFLLRHLIRDQEDVKRALRVLVYVAVIVAGIMISEQMTGRNLYYVLLSGGHTAWYSSVLIRDGKLRATGCFEQPILAGTFGGILLPLFIGWWWKERKDRKFAAVGIAVTTVIPFLANSSTALFAFMGGLLGLCFWPLRKRMRVIRWALATGLIGLHLVMKAPVWHLISRVSLTESSDAEHRYQLVNQCILHFTDWFLMGTKSYADWGYSLWDLGNQYVAYADQSGLIPLLAFLAIFVFGFKYVGVARMRAEGDRKQQFFIWAFGASLFANVVGFFGISYFDQTIVVWYTLLAMISAIAIRQPVKQVRQEAAAPAVAGLVYEMASTAKLEDFEVSMSQPSLARSWHDVADE